jgi:hypothetical protein
MVAAERGLFEEATQMSATRVHVDLLGGTISEFPKRATIVVRYDDKEARIELEVTIRAPGPEVYRRELHQLMTALEVWWRSDGEVTFAP